MRVANRCGSYWHQNGKLPPKLPLTESAGEARSDSISVTILAQTNGSPTVVIDSPSGAASFTRGSSVDFGARSDDPEDRSIGSSNEWTSSIDGALGSGASITISTVSIGTHTSTAAATNSAGATGSDMISMTVSEPATSIPDDDPGSSQGSGGGSLGLPDLFWLVALSMQFHVRKRRASLSSQVRHRCN
jgi:hypothetical protein